MSDNPNENQLEVVANDAVNKLITLKDVVDAITNDKNDSELVNNIRRFKLMIVKNSLTDIMNMMEMVGLVKQSLMRKVREDIDIYPLTTQLDIMSDINSLIDRDLKIVESILPAADNLAEFLEKTNKQVTIVQQINVDKMTPSQVDKVSQIVEAVISQINNMDNGELK